MVDYYKLCGLHQDKKETERILSQMPDPIMAYCGQDIKGSGKGKTVLLYQYLEKLIGDKVVPRLQIGPDCCSMGTALAIDILKGVQHYLNNTYEEWVAETATEPIYGFSRVEIGNSALGFGGGSMGIWCAKSCKDYGTLVRKKYDTVDLTKYNWPLAEQWGRPRRGVPDELEPIAKEHVILNFTQVNTWEEARDAIANGYPLITASSRGFNNVRDKDGFITGRANWPHLQGVIGMKDDHRPGVLILNSWGSDWVSGPKGDIDYPDGAYFVDANIFERDMLSAGDSFALSSYIGFPAQNLDLSLF